MISLKRLEPLSEPSLFKQLLPHAVGGYIEPSTLGEAFRNLLGEMLEAHPEITATAAEITAERDRRDKADAEAEQKKHEEAARARFDAWQNKDGERLDVRYQEDNIRIIGHWAAIRKLPLTVENIDRAVRENWSKLYRITPEPPPAPTPEPVKVILEDGSEQLPLDCPEHVLRRSTTTKVQLEDFIRR